MAGRRDRELRAFVDARGTELAHLALLLTADPARAGTALVDALAHVHRHWSRGEGGDPEASVRAALVRTAVRLRPVDGAAPLRATPADAGAAGAAGAADRDRAEAWGRLAALPPRTRAAVVLRELDDLDDTGIAELVRTRPATVRRELAAGLAALERPAPSSRALAEAPPTASAVGSPTAPAYRRSTALRDDPDDRADVVVVDLGDVSTAPARRWGGGPAHGPAVPTPRHDPDGPFAPASDADGTGWRAVLRAPPVPAPPVDDLADRVLAASRARRSRQRRTGVAVAAVAALAVGGLVAVPALRDDPAPAPEPTAAALGPGETDPRLINWSPRGELAGDEAFLAEVAATWRAALTGYLPGNRVTPIWAGTIGAGRVALVQSLTVDGVPLVAQVADHDGQLWLDRVDVLAQDDPLALVVDYDGDIDLPQTLLGSGANLLAVVVTPSLPEAAVARRTRAVPQDLPGARWDDLDVRADGLTESWLHLVDEEPLGTVVALTRPAGPLSGGFDLVTARPSAIASGDPPVDLVPVSWGPGPAGDFGAYDDALALAGQDFARPFTAGVLWSGSIEAGAHASLFDVAADGTLRLVVRRGGMLLCSASVAAPPLGDDLALSCATRTDVVTLAVAAETDDRVTLVDATSGDEVARGVGATWARTPPGAPPPVPG